MTRILKYNQAIAEALKQAMEMDEDIVIMGEDIQHGGVFGCTRGLFELFGSKRVIDTPLSEAAFVGLAIGAAMCGLRVVVELQYLDFFAVAMDQICNQLAKLSFMSGGQVKLPVVIRAPFGAGLAGGAQHSQTHYSIFAHIPGLKVVAPSTPYDAKGLLLSAVKEDCPVVVFENKVLYVTRLTGEVPEEPYRVEIGKANVVAEGDDLTIIGISRTTHIALAVAKKLAEEGISTEVIDLRTIYPLDEETILRSVKKTGRIVIADEDNPYCSVASEIAARVASKAFDSLKAPVKMVNSEHMPVPFSPPLEKEYMVNEEKLYNTAMAVLKSS